MSFEEVGKGFAQHYYQAFSANRASLSVMYRPTSLMTWNGERLQGVESIMGRFATLQFDQAQFKMEDVDCHPSMSGGVLIVVNGEVLIKDERHPLKFNDVFHLQQENNQWYVSNQLFRIIGGGGM